MSKKENSSRPYRGVIDEIREQQKKMKDMSLKEKFSYFWYYYKVHVLVILLVVIFGGSWIHDIVTAKDFNFYAIMMNSSHLAGESMEASFAEYADLDTENYDCYIDTLSTLSYQQQTETDLASLQKTFALVQTGDLDTMVLDGIVFYNFAFNSMLLDLRQIFTEEELARFEGDIYYIDYAKIKEAEANDGSTDELVAEAQARSKASAEEINAEANEHRNPDTMDEPIPVGIFLDDSPFAKKTKSYEGLVPIYGFVATGQRTETAKQYLEYLLDDSIPFDQMIDVWN